MTAFVIELLPSSTYNTRKILTQTLKIQSKTISRTLLREIQNFRGNRCLITVLTYRLNLYKRRNRIIRSQNLFIRLHILHHL